MSQNGSVPPQSKEDGLSPNTFMLFGLFLIAGGVFLFFYLADLEERGGSVSMHIVVVWMYKLGGKWLVSAFSVLSGTVSLVGGMRARLKSRK